MKGQFVISIIKIDNFDNPSRDLMIYQYEISDQTLTYLHVPAGCITAIQAKEANCKLMVLSDYAMGAIDDEYRFELDYFNRR